LHGHSRRRLGVGHSGPINLAPARSPAHHAALARSGALPPPAPRATLWAPHCGPLARGSAQRISTSCAFLRLQRRRSARLRPRPPRWPPRSSVRSGLEAPSAQWLRVVGREHMTHAMRRHASPPRRAPAARRTNAARRARRASAPPHPGGKDRIGLRKSRRRGGGAGAPGGGPERRRAAACVGSLVRAPSGPACRPGNAPPPAPDSVPESLCPPY